MKQHEAVIQVMKANGGYSTLGLLYSEALKIPDVTWGTKTPFASIRRIVQDDRFFFKIRPGLWALNEYRGRLPLALGRADRGSAKETQFTHSYYQGLLVEIGNLREFQTFVPSQDRGKTFLNKQLSRLATVQTCYSFGYPYLVRKAQTVDVIWFNERKMPQAFLEVEHSTDFQNSLLKFFELQDFNSTFGVVADESRKREFESKLSQSAFGPIAHRVKFWGYEFVSNLHSKISELAALGTIATS